MRTAARCALILCAFIVLAGELEAPNKSRLRNSLSNSGPIALLSQRNKNITSLGRYTESSHSRFFECIYVINLAENVQSSISLSGTLQNFNNLGLGEILVSHNISDTLDIRGDYVAADARYRCQIRENEIWRKRMLFNSHYSRLLSSMGWSFSSINRPETTPHPQIRINIVEPSWHYRNISSQFSSSLDFSGQPQLTSRPPQSQCEQGDQSSGKCGDGGLIRIDENAEAITVARENGNTFLKGLFVCLIISIVYAGLKRL